MRSATYGTSSLEAASSPALDFLFLFFFGCFFFVCYFFFSVFCFRFFWRCGGVFFSHVGAKGFVWFVFSLLMKVSLDGVSGFPKKGHFGSPTFH